MEDLAHRARRAESGLITKDGRAQRTKVDKLLIPKRGRAKAKRQKERTKVVKFESMLSLLLTMVLAAPILYIFFKILTFEKVTKTKCRVCSQMADSEQSNQKTSSYIRKNRRVEKCSFPLEQVNKDADNSLRDKAADKVTYSPVRAFGSDDFPGGVAMWTTARKLKVMNGTLNKTHSQTANAEGFRIENMVVDSNPLAAINVLEQRRVSNQLCFSPLIPFTNHDVSAADNALKQPSGSTVKPGVSRFELGDQDTSMALSDKCSSLAGEVRSSCLEVGAVRKVVEDEGIVKRKRDAQIQNDVRRDRPFQSHITPRGISIKRIRQTNWFSPLTKRKQELELQSEYTKHLRLHQPERSTILLDETLFCVQCDKNPLPVHVMDDVSRIGGSELNQHKSSTGQSTFVASDDSGRAASVVSSSDNGNQAERKVVTSDVTKISAGSDLTKKDAQLSGLLSVSAQHSLATSCLSFATTASDSSKVSHAIAVASSSGRSAADDSIASGIAEGTRAKEDSSSVFGAAAVVQTSGTASSGLSGGGAAPTFGASSGGLGVAGAAPASFSGASSSGFGAAPATVAPAFGASSSGLGSGGAAPAFGASSSGLGSGGAAGAFGASSSVFGFGGAAPVLGAAWSSGAMAPPVSVGGAPQPQFGAAPQPFGAGGAQNGLGGSKESGSLRSGARSAGRGRGRR